MNLAQTHASDVNALKIIYSSLVLVAKVFYSLNFQDLPEFFEDNMSTWMSNFHNLLTAEVKLLETGVSYLAMYRTFVKDPQLHNCSANQVLECSSDTIC